MAESTELISNEWKHNLETTPTKSITSLVSIWDLLYDEDGNFWTDYQSNSTHKVDEAGIKLSHDVICYNRSMIGNSGAIDTITSPAIETSTWWSYGIDIALPRYDARSKYKTIKAENPTFNFPEGASNSEFNIFDKDAALPLLNIKQFTIFGVKANKVLLSSTSEALAWSNYNPPSLGIWSGTPSSSVDIFVSCLDTAFTSTLVTQDSLSAYNRVFLNSASMYARALIVRSLNLNANSLLGGDNFTEWGDFNKTIYDSAYPFYNDLKSYLGEDTYKFLLKNTFVWIRAPFFADYIKAEDFNQDLNQEAKVKHSELMLSGKGDYQKYDSRLFERTKVDVGSTASNNATEDPNNPHLSENSMPYLPRTSPIVDFFTSGFLKENDLSESNDNYSTKLNSSNLDKLKELLNDAIQGNDMPVRGLPATAINRDLVDANIPGWFDPESHYTAEDYIEMGRMLTMLPNDGNLYTDGRIISPTIDEIIYILRKIISGRPSDIQDAEVALDNISVEKDTKGLVRLEKEDIGIPLGTDTNAINADTTLKEATDSEFNFKLGGQFVHGSPIDYMFTGTGEVTVTKYVNQNDTIVYPIYKDLKKVSEDVTTFNPTSNRDITNFTAWKDSTQSDVIKDGEAVGGNSNWAPREAPFSLRELEAMIKANKFNINTLARFLKENFTVSGGLGKKVDATDDDAANVAAGSLYQMHKDYNFDITNPNTFYNANGTDNGLRDNEPVGAKALIDDTDIRSPQQKSEGHIRYMQDYGTSEALKFNQEEYSSSDVYLSASGEWRYVSDHNRIPVLRCEY